MKSPGCTLRALLSVLVATACAGACSGSDDAGISVSFRILGPAAPVAGECPAAADADYGPPVFADAQPDRVRLTYLRPQTDPPLTPEQRFLCDVVLDYQADPPGLVIPIQGAVDLTAEFFAPDGQLLAAGTAMSADLRTGGTVDVRALPMGQFSCAGDRMNVARAFHSATALPDGRVLIVGGAVADAGASTRAVDVDTGLFLTSSVEIFDPADNTFTEVPLPNLRPRAMHQARVHYVEPDGTVTVALFGGFTVADGSVPAIVPLAYGMRWAPAGTAQAAPLELLQVSPDNQVVLFDEEVTAPNLLARHDWLESDRLVRAGGQQLVVDPVTGAESLAPVARFAIVEADTWTEEAGNLPTLIGRQGASVTALDGDTALVWGGHTNALPEQMSTLAGELLIGLSAGGLPEARQIGLLGATPVPRTWHQAARAGDEILLVGGFDFSLGPFAPPAGVLVERLTRVGTTVEVLPLAVAGGGEPPAAGHAQAIPLAGGDVLISGGNPATGYGGCSTNQAGILCSLDTGHVYRSATRALESLPGSMRRGRYAHQMTELPDGRVLVTGGLHAPAPAAELWLADEAELVEPRDASRDVLSLGRAPGEVASSLGGTPLGPCEVIGTVALAR